MERNIDSDAIARRRKRKRLSTVTKWTRQCKVVRGDGRRENLEGLHNDV